MQAEKITKVTKVEEGDGKRIIRTKAKGEEGKEGGERGWLEKCVYQWTVCECVYERGRERWKLKRVN